MAFSSSGALNLLAAYNSSGDDSEDEIPGPRVSVKRTKTSDESFESSRKRQATVDPKKRYITVVHNLVSHNDGAVTFVCQQ